MEAEAFVRQARPDVHRAVAFGTRWQSDFALQAFEPSSAIGSDTQPDVTVCHLAGEPPPRVVLHARNRIQHMRDGIRFVSEEFTADTFRANRIEIHTGPAWPGHLPPSFFGTVTAALMTWRGGIAMHASAVEVDGEAVLLCGASGAGKSTLTAALIAAGARLISDDLSVLQTRPGGGAPVLFAGRRTLRLFPEVAEMLGGSVQFDSSPGTDGRKWIVTPPRVDPHTAFPLRGALLLTRDTDEPEFAANPLRTHLYRRHAFSYIPGHALRVAQLANLFQQGHVLRQPAVEARTQAAFAAIAPETLSRISKFSRSRPL